MAVIVNIKLTWSLFYVLSVSEFIIRTIRTPARRVCGSIYLQPGSRQPFRLHTGCDEILEKALEMVRTGEYDSAAEK